MTTKDQITELIDRLAEKEYHPADKLKQDPQIHPVRLGDVIEKKDVDSLSTMLLITHWRACGISKSLQQIVEEAEWHKQKMCCCSMMGATSHLSDCIKDKETLKSPEATSLFLLLKELFHKS